MLKNLFVLLLFSLLTLSAHADALLEETVELTSQYASAGYLPIIVMDLDETVIDSHDRKVAAMNEALDGLRSRYSRQAELSSYLNSDDLRSQENAYDLRGALMSLGVSNATFLDKLEAALLPIYLSNKYMDLDREVPGAVNYIYRLEKAGGRIIYVSSRYEDTQKEGTIESLSVNSLLYGDTEIFLRPRSMNSLQFKQWAFHEIQEEVARNPQSFVTAVFENEPENLNAMIDAFPYAQAFFVEGAYMKDIPLEKSQAGPIDRIKNYAIF